jgi:hypothetical protein
MKNLGRLGGIWVGVCLALTAAVLVLILSLYSPAIQARAAPASAPKPADGWYVCRDLGYGSVPGVAVTRQRIKVCHDTGWEVYTYCTQPGRPVPPVGRRCTRISEDTYRCGARNQLLREYRILQIPPDTPAPIPAQAISTAAPTPITTAAWIPTSTPPVFMVTPTSFLVAAQQTGRSNSTLLRVLLACAIGSLVLVIVFAIWFLWRMYKNR